MTMTKQLLNNNQNKFDHNLFIMDCQLGRASIIPLKKEEFNIIKNWEGFSSKNDRYNYKGHLIFLI